MKATLFLFCGLLLLLAHAAQAQSRSCEDACASGYAAFRRWCFSMGPTAPCTSLVNSPRQFTAQACLRFCVH